MICGLYTIRKKLHELDATIKDERQEVKCTGYSYYSSTFCMYRSMHSHAERVEVHHSGEGMYSASGFASVHSSHSGRSTARAPDGGPALQETLETRC